MFKHHTHQASSQRKLTSVRKELHSFDFLANAGIQDEEDSSKRTIAPVDLGHLNKLIDPFGEFIVLDPRIREEDAGVKPPRLTSVIRVESCFPDSSERKLGSSDKKPLFSNKINGLFAELFVNWIPAFAGMTQGGLDAILALRARKTMVLEQGTSHD